MPEVLDYLASKNLFPKTQHGTEAQFHCFFCDEAHNKRGRLYVNLDESLEPGGLYHCKICGSKGNLYTLKRHFGDPVRDNEVSRDNHYLILQAAARYYHESLDEEQLVYLKGRGLTVDTIQRQMLGYCDGTWIKGRHCLFDLDEVVAAGVARSDGSERLQGLVTIPYIVNGNVVQIRGKDPRGKYVTLPGDKARLFNLDATSQTDDQILVCEGEFDCMMATQAGFQAVGVAGAQNWQDRWSEYFAKIRRVYTLFDNDEAGRAGALKISVQLGPKVRIVNLADIESPDKFDLSDWFNAGHTPDDLHALVRSQFSTLLVTVDDAYVEWLEQQHTDPVSFGFADLDLALKGGMRPGQIAVPLAKTGVGKTLTLLNIFHRVLEQDPKKCILFISLEQTKFEWLERARLIYQFYHPHAEVGDVLDFFRPRFLICEQNRLNEEQFLICLDDFKDQMGRMPDLVAIDYLGYWTHSFKGEPYQRVSAGIMTLKAIAKEQRIAVITPHQVGRASAESGKSFGAEAARDSGVVEETADFVFAMWSKSVRDLNLRPLYRKSEIHLRIAKSRHGGKDREFKFLYAPLSQALVGENDLLNERAKADAYYNDIPLNYEDALREHRNGDNRWKKER